MKILLSAVLLNVLSVVCFAQSYLGTYDEVPPFKIAKDPDTLKAWKMMQMQIKITPGHITFYWPGMHPDVGGEDNTFTEHGQFLLATREGLEGTMFDAIYVFDKDTIFTRGFKFVRIKDPPEKK